MLETVGTFDADTAPDSATDANASVSALIRMAGLRVLQTRKSQGMSRRELSERSGVSSRYLAKLETGDGNISIGLLKKVALALATPIEVFLAEGDLQANEVRQITELFRRADAATRARVLQILDPERVRAEKAGRLCLVGLRGAGKSTLGNRMGAEFGVPFIELNTEIERSAGIPLGEIIALYGQEGYRQLEANALTDIIGSYDRAVVAVAGGIVAEEDTFQQVLSRFHTIWVKTSAREHMERVRAQGDVRPMQGNPQAMTQLRQIMRSREACYARADHWLDTSGKSLGSSHYELTELIKTKQLLGPGTA